MKQSNIWKQLGMRPYMTFEQIAEKLGVAKRTVQKDEAHAFEKIRYGMKCRNLKIGDYL